MKLLKKIYLPALGIVLCRIIFHIEGTTEYFGALINRLIPCVQEQTTSFPCYAVYDIVIMGILIITQLILLAVIIFRIINFLRKKH